MMSAMALPCKKLVRDLRASANREHALKELRRLEHLLPDRESRFGVPQTFSGKGHFKSIQPRQNPVEIQTLYRHVCQLNPQRVLEIGTARGGTLYLWCQAATDDATLISVDLPGGEFGGGYLDCRTPLYQQFARPQQTLHLLRADSHQPATFDHVQQLLSSAPLDFAFIDGDHTYEGVKADFNRFGPLVRPGGLIAFHDIVPRTDGANIHVDRLWSELKPRHDCTDIVGPEGSGRQIGIGLLRVGEAPVQPFD